MVIVVLAGLINSAEALCLCAIVDGGGVSFDSGSGSGPLLCANVGLDTCNTLCIANLGLSALNLANATLCNDCCSCCCGSSSGTGPYAPAGPCERTNGDCK